MTGVDELPRFMGICALRGERRGKEGESRAVLSSAVHAMGEGWKEDGYEVSILCKCEEGG